MNNKKEFRVTFQRDVGHQRQTRLYQREHAAKKFYESLPSDLYLKRLDTRRVSDWTPRMISQRSKANEREQ